MELTKPISFESAIQKFVSDLKSQKRSSATVTAYTGDLCQLQKFLNDKKITQATTTQTIHLQEFLDHLLSTGYTTKSISRKINSFKTFFKYLKNHNLNPVDPSASLSHPKYETALPRILTTSEYKSIRESARLDIRISAILEILLQTGIRISELANIRLQDIAKNELLVTPLENNPARSIPLHKSVVSSVQNYLSIRPKVSIDHLFITKTGKPLLIRNIRTSLDRYFKIAGVKSAKVNDLRNTFLAHQLAAGINPEFLSKIVGHKRLTSTYKYLDGAPLSTSTSTKLIEL